MLVDLIHSFCSFGVLFVVNYIYWFLNIKQLLIPRILPTWSWCVILLICCLICYITKKLRAKKLGSVKKKLYFLLENSLLKILPGFCLWESSELLIHCSNWTSLVLSKEKGVIFILANSSPQIAEKDSFRIVSFEAFLINGAGRSL